MTDQDLLFDVNLPALLPEQLMASWRVVGQRVRSAAPEVGWVGVTRLELGEEVIRVDSSSMGSLTGSWLVKRSSLLGQPYLVLALPGSRTQALVTRFRRSADGRRRHLMLYFQSGMELELSHP